MKTFQLINNFHGHENNLLFFFIGLAHRQKTLFVKSLFCTINCHFLILQIDRCQLRYGSRSGTSELTGTVSRNYLASACRPLNTMAPFRMTSKVRKNIFKARLTTSINDHCYSQREQFFPESLFLFCLDYILVSYFH